MRKDDLRGMTRLELLEEAKRLEIRGRNAMSKDELIDAMAAATRSKPDRGAAKPAAEAGATRKPRKSGKDEPTPASAEASPRSRSRATPAGITATDRAARPSGAPRASDGARAAIDAPPPAAAAPPPAESTPRSATPAPAAGRAPGEPPPSAARGLRTHRPSPHDEDDEDGQNWNSTALGRDPNYGRFLNPGSIPSRNAPPARRVPGGPPSPIAKSLAERSELGRQRAGERSYGARDDLRRSGIARRDSAYTPRYERDRCLPDARKEHGRGRGEEHPARGHQGTGGSGESGRGGRAPGGAVVERRLPGEGRADREDRRIAGDARPERDSHRASDRLPTSGAPAQPRGGPLAPDEVRRRGSHGGGRSSTEAPRPRGDTGEETRPAGGAVVGEIRPRAPEPPVPPPPRALDRCRLLVRDPYCVHAYWEVTEESVERITTELGDEFKDSRPILRVHGIPVSGDPDEPQAGFFDVVLATDATSAYVDVPRANRGYRVDVGMLTAQGLFFPLASSNTVITPRDAASRNTTQTRVEPPAAPAAPAAPGAPATPGDALEGTGPAGPGPAAGPAKAAGEAPAESTGSGARPVASRSRKATPAAGGRPGDAATSRLEGDAVAGESGAGLAPETDLGMTSGRGLAPAGPGIPPGPTGRETAMPLSEPAPLVPAPFHFTLHTELVVYGSTELGAAVTLQGTPVTLRPDGTFSVRIQLPDGEQELRAVAVSRDGKVERTITPVVTRRTIEDSEQAKSPDEP